jgi:peptidoglycan hydrolase CwlO-like protein
MSFSKTISVVAALASIFAAGAAGWKLANENQSQPVDQTQVEQTQDVSAFEEKINDLEKQLEEVKEQPKPVVVQQPTVLPPVVAPPPPAPVTTETQP